MKYEEWLDLSETERAALQTQWNAYGDGYWHELVREAADRFRARFRTTPHVLKISHGLYHCGELIIAVHTDLPYPHKVPLPESYAGFRVLQFGGA